MWVARLYSRSSWAKVHVLKRPVDKNDPLSLSRAEFKKPDSGGNRSFATIAHHLRLIATNPPGQTFPEGF
jgi:hypothetical protein